MLVTLLGIERDDNSLQPANAAYPIFCTPFGIKLVLPPRINVFDAVSISALQFSRESKALLSSATFIEVRFGQSKNALSPILFTPLPMVREVRPKQALNAAPPMLVTLLGMVTEVRLLQLMNAKSPMLVTLLGIETEVRLLQPLNVYLPIVVTLLGIVTEVRPLHPEYLYITVYQCLPN